MGALQQIAGSFGGAPPPFSPASIADLERWYKANDESLADNDPVDLATDKSGKQNGSASGSARPTFKTNIVNGKSIYRFDGIDDVLSLGDLSAMTAGEMLIVVKIDNHPPGADPQSGSWSLGTSGQSAHYPYTDGSIYESFGTDTRKTVGNPTPSLLSAFRIYQVWSAANDWAAYLDNSLLHSTGTNTVGFPSSATLGQSLGAYFLDGDVAEYVLYSRKLTSGERSDLYAYAQGEYGL